MKEYLDLCTISCIKFECDLFRVYRGTRCIHSNLNCELALKECTIAFSDFPPIASSICFLDNLVKMTSHSFVRGVESMAKKSCQFIFASSFFSWILAKYLQFFSLNFWPIASPIWFLDNFLRITLHSLVRGAASMSKNNYQ